jgi:uncharacterized protein YbaR (Trm112 family)
MIHGPSRILTCPHCKSKKEVISLLSGNTSGGVVWSDQYVKCPFYEVASYIQKCPHCEKYYIIEDEIELLLPAKEVKEMMGDTECADSQCFQILNTKIECTNILLLLI